jgi:predicted O-methyltransferase YrrM
MMANPALVPPSTDPTPIFEHFRGNYASELLVAASAHFNLFGRLAAGPIGTEELRRQLGLAERPFIVLTTALRAMALLDVDAQRRMTLTPLAAQHLVALGEFDVSDYLGLAANSAGVREMVERLRSNTPAGQSQDETGVGFIYREGLPSAMEHAESARHFTLALAGRARNVAPVLAACAPLADARKLVDVGGGTGIYSIACLLRYPTLRAVVWDRAEVLKIAAEFAARYGVADRLELCEGDMFVDPVPEGDVQLMSNILHDWDVPQCQELLARAAAALARGGRLMIHDVYLNDALDGPLPIALYSAALYSATQGRAYSAGEYRGWMAEVGLRPQPLVPTLIHCGLLVGMKPS